MRNELEKENYAKASASSAGDAKHELDHLFSSDDDEDDDEDQEDDESDEDEEDDEADDSGGAWCLSDD